MKKILFASAAVLALASCSHTEDLIFDDSAADRLTNGRTELADALTAQGGLWAMEYFANDEEPGYVMLMRFSKNGSVTVSADHKWIGSTYKEETSLWEPISDNGTVLSFCTYNNLFHVFSTPENITGPDAPKNPDSGSDINELGYGHNGDYEFEFMSVNNDVMRLVGKKRGYNIYMHRLPEDTDCQAYLANISAMPSRFGAKFPMLLLTDAEGNEYELSDLETSIPSVFPREGDSVEQTTSRQGIFTASGFRFDKELHIFRPDGSQWDLSQLYWAEDGSLVNTEMGVTLKAPSPVENFNRTDLNWNVDVTSFTGKFKELYDAANAELGSTLRLKSIQFTRGAVNNVMTWQMVSTLGTKLCKDYVSYSAIKGTELKLTETGENSTSTTQEGKNPAYKAFKDALFAATLELTNADAMNPVKLIVADANNPESTFVVTTK